MKEQLAQRAVFDILRRSPLTEAEAALYRRPIADLIRQGIARRRDDGAVELVGSTTYASAGSSPPAAPLAVSDDPPMPTISVRISHEDMAFVNACEARLGLSRADAVRTILERARLQGERFLGSGARRRSGT